VPRWTAQPSVVVFDEAGRIIARGVCGWAGIPLPDAQVPAVAADLVAMVDGFATLGPRHWRARRARGRRERWLEGLIEDVHGGTVTVAAGTPIDVVAHHRDGDGAPLDPRVAAVELLNIIRPTVAVSWFVAFPGHALHRWPQHRVRLREGDQAFTEAFAHEVRRFYPFAPFIGGRAVRDLSWRGQPIAAGSLVLLDLYGQNHDAGLWPEAYRFDPERFINRHIGAFELVAHGGGDPRTGHRCPGEGITVALLEALSVRLARLDFQVARQDLTIPLGRIPTRPRSGFLISTVRPAPQSGATAAVSAADGSAS
jgi:fatty-acid peroxygenase